MKYLYVHIPFCDHICSYCDFSKVFYKEDWANQYLDALEYEIKDKQLEGCFDTIYIGGGTPSSLSLNQLKRLFDILKPFSFSTVEYSIEVNPESMNEDKLDMMIDYGVNRISIGVQSFHNHLLKNIQRNHDAMQAKDLISLVYSKGISDINVDLMYGLPSQTFEQLKSDLQELVTFPISHISVYSLILEDHTTLKNMNYTPLDDEQDALWYDYINHTLNESGFIHYEVSNYYKTKPSYHNLAYWHYEDYEGIGLGAHSLKNSTRYMNTRSLKEYLNHNYLNDKEQLSKEDSLFEKIMMGLRLTEGINLDVISNEYNINIEARYKDTIEKYIKINFMEYNKPYLKVTKIGMNYLNTILVDFLED